MNTALLVLSAVAPALLLLWYFHARDVYPEPPRVVWATFGLGVASVVPAVMLAMAIEAAVGEPADPWAAGLAAAFLTAALPEDLAKFAVLYFFCLRRSEFNDTHGRAGLRLRAHPERGGARWVARCRRRRPAGRRRGQP